MCQSRGQRDNLRRESVFSFLQVYPGDEPYVVSLVATSLLNILAWPSGPVEEQIILDPSQILVNHFKMLNFESKKKNAPTVRH